jgi:tetratricopeptide (TPR) repeat protein
MSYAGNPSLSSDVQNRVLGTFEQTLGLAAEGSRQEALLGCDFVLRMDPHFEPARQLQERLRNSSGPVRVDDLLAPAAPGPGMTAPAGNLRSHFQSLLDARQFQELMALAQQNQAAVGGDAELMRIATEAQERLEAAPYVNKFVNAAREAARQGNRDEAARAIEKIRALDPTHPVIAELSGASMAPAAAPPATRPGMPATTMPVLDPFAADVVPAGDSGFELALDEPSFGASLDTSGFGTDLPELTFDEPSLDFGATAEAPSLMDPELISAADFQTDMLASMPSVSSSGDSETDRRIQQLLDEGQAAYGRGDVQAAIDAWSRIFLIDIDHQEAARRIDQARKVKAESERQAEEIFHEGVAKLEAGDLGGAKQTFQRVLEIQPSYFAAREYLQQLEAGQVPTIRPSARHEPAPQPALPTPSDLDLDTGTGELKEEILIPPDPSELAAAERQKPKPRAAAPVREKKARKTFALVGSAVLVLALAGGAFVYLNKDRLFPNSQTEDSSAQGSGEDPIARAMNLHKEGKTQSALSQLRRLPADDPAYAKAQELIAQWDTGSAPQPGAAPAPGPAAPAAPAIPPERLALLTSARDAYQGRSYLASVERYEKAEKNGRLDASDTQMLADARRQIEPLASLISLFKQSEWELALRDLWRLHEADPANRDVTRLMVDSYYNLALRELKRTDPKEALKHFLEARDLDPADPDLRRQIEFTQAYLSKPKDMLYRIYVKHLPTR